ncbi:hypothetical protein [Moritella sp. Urea-trap-13]|uniref:hypothetical protein n=1 Tax=Moritella sp. Urea-trap-13 TaxID=2058327 RepID=UPI0012FF2C11|nr:hypothetical protein [Moritella sp. Urea-trap-13]
MIQLRPMTSSEYPACCDYFIDDFFIFSNSRNNGYGKLAIIALESQLKSIGIEQIQLL